jgi:hypothetical protein
MKLRAWRKVLYIRQDYPDNYVDQGQFLHLRTKNRNVRLHSYVQVWLAMLSITQQVTCVMVFTAIFVLLYQGHCSHRGMGAVACARAGYTDSFPKPRHKKELVLWTLLLAVVGGWIYYHLHTHHQAHMSPAERLATATEISGSPVPMSSAMPLTPAIASSGGDCIATPAQSPLGVGNDVDRAVRTQHAALRLAWTSALFIALLMGVSPILQTLTREISSDTIWSLTCACFLANITFHEYSALAASPLLVGAKMVRFPDSISINAGIFASVLLASR